MYFGMPMIILPVTYIFLFGQYDDINVMLFSLGMMKMLNTSFENMTLHHETHERAAFL
jgi:hypothetical protein